MDIIDIAIAKQLSGGGGTGSGLPSVTSADNMKALAVVNGQWAVGDAGYKVSSIPTEVIPEQTVQCVEGEYGYSDTALNYVTLDQSYTGKITFIYDGTTYANIEANVTPDDEAYWIIPNVENELFEFYYDSGWRFYAENEDTHTIKGIVGTDTIEVSDEFSEAVNSCVEVPTPQSELPSITGKGGAFLQVNAREEGVIWSNFNWTLQGSSTNPYIVKNDDLRIKRYFFNGELVSVRSTINQYNFGTPTANALLPVYSSNGLEIVFKIDGSGQANTVYDKNTTTTNTAGYGDVIVFY